MKNKNTNVVGFAISYFLGFFLIAFVVSVLPRMCTVSGDCTSESNGWGNGLGVASLIYIVGAAIVIESKNNKIQELKDEVEEMEEKQNKNKNFDR